jgi:O-antigen ligase
MSLATDTRLSTPDKIAGAFGIGFGFFAGAGVTGLSLMIGLLGLWALVYGFGSAPPPLGIALWQGLVKRWFVWISFLGFVGWAMVSATWSPAPELAAETVRRLGAMVILAPIAIWASVSPARMDALNARRAILGGLAIALFILTFETLTGAAINKVASPEKDPLAIAGDLGRAATASLSLFWVGFACLKRDVDSPKLLIGYVVVCAFIAFQFGTDLNTAGLALGCCATLLALNFPRVAIGTLSASCAVIVICAPLLYPFLAKLAIGLAPGGHLPMSYGRRVQMWNFAADLIAQKPLAGWGVGASSTFDKIVRFEGFDWPQIQLHPHAAPLHIWLETGAVGALLASAAIIAAGGAALSAFGRHKAAASAFVGGMTFLALHWGLSHAIWREWMWTSFAAVIAFSLALRDYRPKPVLLEEDDDF